MIISETIRIQMAAKHIRESNEQMQIHKHTLNNKSINLQHQRKSYSKLSATKHKKEDNKTTEGIDKSITST